MDVSLQMAALQCAYVARHIRSYGARTITCSVWRPQDGEPPPNTAFHSAAPLGGYPVPMAD